MYPCNGILLAGHRLGGPTPPNRSSGKKQRRHCDAWSRISAVFQGASVVGGELQELAQSTFLNFARPLLTHLHSISQGRNLTSKYFHYCSSLKLSYKSRTRYIYQGRPSCSPRAHSLSPSYTHPATVKHVRHGRQAVTQGPSRVP